MASVVRSTIKWNREKYKYVEEYNRGVQIS